MILNEQLVKPTELEEILSDVEHCEISKNWGLLFSLNGGALEESTHISIDFTPELVQSQNSLS